MVLDALRLTHQVLLHLLDRLFRDRETKFFLCYRQVQPQLSPCVKAHLISSVFVIDMLRYV